MSRETIYYYTPQKSADDRLLTNVALSMGIRFRRIEKNQLKQQIGCIAGLPGFSAAKNEAGSMGANDADAEISTPAGETSERKEPAAGSAAAKNDSLTAGSGDADTGNNTPAEGAAAKSDASAAGSGNADTENSTPAGGATAENESAADAGPDIPDKILIMQGFSRRRLDEFLRAMRRKKVPAIPLKAILTETNSQWTVAKLYLELYKENAYMTGQNKQEE